MKRRGGIIIGFILLMAAFCWFGGFMLFCREVFFYADNGGEPTVKATLPFKEETVTGITALTGGRNRIAKALELLEHGAGERLLISGVKPKTELKSIAAREKLILKEGLPIDLGYQATDTVGNGIEVKAWAHKHKINRLLVVTSFYHIPRARLELSHAMGGKELVFYAVQSPYVLRRWWTSVKSFLFLAAEYTKFLAVYTQYKMLGL